MATDITKLIENSLLELQKNAKAQIAKIVNMDEFAEQTYALMLSTLIDIENSHNETYKANSEHVLEHSSITFNIANANKDRDTFSLVSLVEIENFPKKLEQSYIQEEFIAKYHDIIAKCNTNGKAQNFKLSGMEVSSFYNKLIMLLKNNRALCTINSDKATEQSY